MTSSANLLSQQEYCPPEASTGEIVTRASDWWAFGIVLYEMLVGIPPFFSQNPANLKTLISSRPVVYPDPVRYHMLVTDAAKELIGKVNRAK